MATLAEAEAHRSSVEDVATIAVAQLLAEWPNLPLDDPLALSAPLGDLLAELIQDFAAATAALGADWYDELREASEVPGLYVADLADEVSLDRILSSADWAAGGAWVDEQKALRDASAFLERIVAEGDRDTIDLNVGRDPASPRYARYASADACAFCALNATRGPVFRTEDAAGNKYHDHCRCIAVPVWDRADYDEAPYVADWRKAYYAATKALGRGADPKAILAHMRQHAGLR